jgi:capsule polysaccharide export protein KpsE/RkpR
MTDVVQGFRQALQDLLTPEVRELKAEIKGLRVEMNAEIKGLRLERNANDGALRQEISGLRAEMNANDGALRQEVSGLRAEMNANIGAVKQEISSLRAEMNANDGALQQEISGLRAEFQGLRSEMHNGFHLLQVTLENAVLRGDKENIREMADLRDRVTRLESRPEHSLPQ